MCEGAPANVTEALARLRGALNYLNRSDAASLPGEVQAEVLRELERAESRHTAARARYLAAFAAQGQYEADGQGTVRAWLKWQTQVTSGAAGGAVGWARRLAAHPVIDHALAAGELSASWARHLCTWTDRLPPEIRDSADQILREAAAEGMALRDLGDLAEEIYRRTRPPVPSGDGDDEDGAFEDRYLRVGVTFGGAGHTEGALTPGCAHALTTVLEALGKKAGPEDTRTAGQRRHDALEEACRRLIGGGMVPARAGQPTHLTVHMTLNQLRGLPAASEAEATWAAAQAATRPGWLTGPAADAAACDATITPVVTGHLDPVALDLLTRLFQASHHRPGTRAADGRTGAAADSGAAAPGTGGLPDPGPSGPERPSAAWPPAGETLLAAEPVAAEPGTTPAPATQERLRRALLGLAIQALSGPGGLAAHLRTALATRGSTPSVAGAMAAPAAALSLPLDIGAATVTIPAHIRKAAGIRHRRCAFPGCQVPFPACDLHHLIPRSRGGPTSLVNLAPLCHFHHQIAIHRWGWALALHPDGTTTASSPDGSRVLHSHGPPGHNPPRPAA